MYTLFTKRNLYYGENDSCLLSFNIEHVSVNDSKSNFPFYVFSKSCSKRSSYRIKTKKDLHYIVDKMYKSVKKSSEILIISDDLNSVNKISYNDFINDNLYEIKDNEFYVFANLKFTKKDIEQIKYLMDDSPKNTYYAYISNIDDFISIVSSTSFNTINDIIVHNGLNLYSTDYSSDITTNSNCNSSLFLYEKILSLLPATFSSGSIYRYFLDIGLIQEHNISNDFELACTKSAPNVFLEGDIDDDFDSVEISFIDEDDEFYDLDDEELYYDDEEFYYDDEFYDDDDSSIGNVNYVFKTISDLEEMIEKLEDSFSNTEYLEKSFYLTVLQALDDSVDNYALVRVNEHTTNLDIINSTLSKLKSIGLDACLVESKSLYILVER